VADATGMFVVPGLIDIHAHIFFGTERDAYLSNGESAVPPDSHSFRSGQTTLVDAGGAGWRNFPQFKEQVIDRARTRVLSFINIVGSGMKGGPAEQNLADMDARLTAMRIRTHRVRVVQRLLQRDSPVHSSERSRLIALDRQSGAGQQRAEPSIQASSISFTPTSCTILVCRR
jgi:predicted amidohydrolase